MANVAVVLGAMILVYALVDRILKFKERKKDEVPQVKSDSNSNPPTN